MGDPTDSAIQTAGRLVLVVDDEPIVRMMAIELFEELGCRVIEAASGQQALAKLDEHPDVSLMFTDCRMPVMTGTDLAEVTAKRWPNLRIVLVTGFHNVEACGWPMIWKPYDYRTLDRVLNGDFAPAACNPVVVEDEAFTARPAAQSDREANPSGYGGPTAEEPYRGR